MTPQVRLKCRAWDTRDNTMGRISEINFRGTEIWVQMGSIETGIRFDDEAPNLILMYFTGYTDRNGKDIYEGDILKYYGEKACLRAQRKDVCEKCGHITRRYTDHKPYVIQWKDAGFSCENDDNWMAPEIWTEMEIIGNIYQKPVSIDN